MKETINRTKMQMTELEMIPADDISNKELISKIYEEVIQFNIKKKKKNQAAWLKNGQIWIHIFIRKIYRWQTDAWKDAQHHWSPEKCKSHNKISPPTCQNVYYQKENCNNYREGCGEKETLTHCWQKYKLEPPLWKIVWRVLKKIKKELLYDRAIPLLGIYLKKKKKTLLGKDIFTHYVHCSIVYSIAKIWKQPKCPLMDEWKRRSGIKKSEILPFATARMDLEGIMLKSDGKNQNTVWFHLYVECKK